MKPVWTILLILSLTFLVSAEATVSFCNLSPITLEKGKTGYSFVVIVQSDRTWTSDYPDVQVFLSQDGHPSIFLDQSTPKVWSGHPYRKEGTGVKPVSFDAGSCALVCKAGSSSKSVPCTVVDHTQAVKQTIQSATKKTPESSQPKKQEPTAPGRTKPPAQAPVPEIAPKVSSGGYDVTSIAVGGKTGGEYKQFFGAKTAIAVRVQFPVPATGVHISLGAYGAAGEKIWPGINAKNGVNYFTLTDLPEGTYRIAAVLTDSTGARQAALSWAGTLVSIRTDAAKKFLTSGATFKETYDSLEAFCKDLVKQRHDLGQLPDDPAILAQATSECVSTHGAASSQFLLGQAIQDTDNRLHSNLEGMGSGWNTNLISGTKEGVANLFGAQTAFTQLTQHSDGLHLLDRCRRTGVSISTSCNSHIACIGKVEPSPSRSRYKELDAQLEEACKDGTIAVIGWDERHNTNGDPAALPQRLEYLYNLGQMAENNRKYDDAYRYYMSGFNLLPSNNQFNRGNPNFNYLAKTQGQSVADWASKLYYAGESIIKRGDISSSASCTSGLMQCAKGIATVGNAAIMGGTVLLALIPGPGWFAIGKQVVQTSVAGYFAIQISIDAVKQARDGKKFTSAKICELSCKTAMIALAVAGAAKSAKEVGSTKAMFFEGQRVGSLAIRLGENRFGRFAQGLVDSAVRKNPNSAWSQGARAVKASKGAVPPLKFDGIPDKDFETGLKADVDASTTRIKELGVEANTLQKRAAKLIQKIRDLDAKISKAKGAEKADLQSKRKIAASDLQEVHANLLRIQVELASHSNFLSRKYGGTAKTPEGTARAQKAQAQVQPVIESVKAGLAKVKAQVDLIEKGPSFQEPLTPEEAQAKAQKIKSDVETTLQKADALEAEALAKEKEASDIEQKFADATEDLRQGAREINAKRRLARELNDQADRLNAQSAKLLEDLKAIQERIDGFEKELSDAPDSADKKGIQQTIDQFKAQYDKLFAQANRLGAQANQAKLKAEALINEAQALEAKASDVAKQLAHAADLRDQAAQLRQQEKALREQAVQLKQQAAQLTRPTLSSRIKAVTTFLGNKFSAWNKRFQEWRQRVRDAQQAKKDARFQRDQLIQAGRLLQKGLEQYRKEVAQYQKQFSQAAKGEPDVSKPAGEPVPELTDLDHRAQAVQPKVDATVNDAKALPDPATSVEPAVDSFAPVDLSATSKIESGGQTRTFSTTWLSRMVEYMAVREKQRLLAFRAFQQDLELDPSATIDGVAAIDWFSAIWDRALNNGLTRAQTEANLAAVVKALGGQADLSTQASRVTATTGVSVDPGVDVNTDVRPAVEATRRIVADTNPPSRTGPGPSFPGNPVLDPAVDWAAASVERAKHMVTAVGRRADLAVAAGLANVKGGDVLAGFIMDGKANGQSLPEILHQFEAQHGSLPEDVGLTWAIRDFYDALPTPEAPAVPPAVPPSAPRPPSSVEPVSRSEPVNPSTGQSVFDRDSIQVGKSTYTRDQLVAFRNRFAAYGRKGSSWQAAMEGIPDDLMRDSKFAQDAYDVYRKEMESRTSQPATNGFSEYYDFQTKVNSWAIKLRSLIRSGASKDDIFNMIQKADSELRPLEENVPGDIYDSNSYRAKAKVYLDDMYAQRQNELLEQASSESPQKLLSPQYNSFNAALKRLNIELGMAANNPGVTGLEIARKFELAQQELQDHIDKISGPEKTSAQEAFELFKIWFQGDIFNKRKAENAGVR